MFKNYTVSELTAETTEEFLRAPLESAQDSLAEAATTRQASHDIVRWVMKVAEYEGQYITASRFVHALRNGASRQQAAMYVMGHITGSGADDTWSGRGPNEAARARFDGRREMAHEIFNYVLSSDD